VTASTPLDAGGRDDHPLPAPASSTASEAATDQPGTRRFDQRIRTGSTFRDRRFYLLPGACVTYEFKLTGTGAEEAAGDISRALGFVGRDQLADQVRSYSGGRLQLDPGRPR
jgi:hypothetical protein